MSFIKRGDGEIKQIIKSKKELEEEMEKIKEEDEKEMPKDKQKSN
jgi:hypothetical protein